jgi:hypothetical protein
MLNVKYATTFTDMQNMWIKKYAKYVAYAKYVNEYVNNMQYNMLKNMQLICQICNYIIKYAEYVACAEYARYAEYAITYAIEYAEIMQGRCKEYAD